MVGSGLAVVTSVLSVLSLATLRFKHRSQAPGV